MASRLLSRSEPPEACRRPGTAPDRVKVAVCVVGFARTLSSRVVHQSIAKTFRDGAEATFDFFGVISLGDREQDTAKGQRYPVSAASIARARHALHPIGWDQASLRQPGPRACVDPCMTQFERLEQCGQLLAAEEARCGRNYSWVVKARTDTLIAGSVASWAGLNRSFLWKDRWAGDSLVLLPRDKFDGITRALGSGNMRAYVPFNPSLEKAAQPQSCWGVCSPTSLCRCSHVLYTVGHQAGLTPRYHTLQTSVQRTPEAAMAYGIGARLAALSGRTRNASRTEWYHIKQLHNWGWAQVDQANRSVQAYVANGSF